MQARPSWHAPVPHDPTPGRHHAPPSTPGAPPATDGRRRTPVPRRSRRRRLGALVGVVLSIGVLPGMPGPAAARVPVVSADTAATAARDAGTDQLGPTADPDGSATEPHGSADAPTPGGTTPTPGASGPADPRGPDDEAAASGDRPSPQVPTPFGAGVPAQGVVVRPAGYGDVRLGPYPGPSGAPEHGYCVQARVYPSGPGDVPLNVGFVADPLLAAALAEHRGSTDDLTQAALALTVHQRHERPGTMEGGNPDAAVAAVLAATPAAVRARQAEILTQAARVAGPFTADVAGVDAAERRTGVLRGIALRSATGEVIAGKPFTVTLHGPAVLDASGTATYSGTTGTEPIDLTWTATGSGAVTTEVRFHGATRTTLTLYDMAGNRQDQISYGNRPGHDPETITRELPAFDVAADFQPVAVSDVAGSKVVDAGQVLGDTLTVGAAEGETWLRVDGVPVPVLFEGTAYGVGAVPVPQRAEPPADAPVVARATITATGPGTYTATAEGPATGQVVTWVWRVVKADQPAAHRDLVRADWSDHYGVPDETTSVRWTTGTVDTALSTRVTKGGTYLVDDLMVTGLPEDHPDFAGGHGLRPDVRTLTQQLWFFPEGVPVDDAHLGSADLRGSVEVPARNGYHPSVSHPGFRVQERDGRPVPGTYVFRTVFAGDDRVAAFTTSVTDVTEQLVVATEPLGVTTVARADRDLVAGQPAVLHDVATVTGSVPEGATLEFALHRWEGEQPVCDERTLVDRTVPVALTGPGEHLSTPVTVESIATGRYGYVETVRDADGGVLHRGECGLAAETLSVRPAVPARPAPSQEPTRSDAPTPTPTPAGSPAPLVEPAAPSTPSLAVTGAPLAASAGIAVLALAVGTAALGVSRRRAARRITRLDAGAGGPDGAGEVATT